MSLNVEGLDELENYLEELPKKDAKKAVRRGLTPGARKLVDAARAAAPVDTGRLRKAIKAKSTNRKYLKYSEVARDLYINPGKSRDDPKGAWYGPMVDSGYISKSGKHVPGHHFMDKAYNSTADIAASIAQEKILEQLEKAADTKLKK